MRPPGTQPFSDQHQASASTIVPETSIAPSIFMVLSCHEAKSTSTQRKTKSSCEHTKSFPKTYSEEWDEAGEKVNGNHC